jgi:hypothetical protein
MEHRQTSIEKASVDSSSRFYCVLHVLYWTTIDFLVVGLSNKKIGGCADNTRWPGLSGQAEAFFKRILDPRSDPTIFYLGIWVPCCYYDQGQNCVIL